MESEDCKRSGTKKSEKYVDYPGVNLDIGSIPKRLYYAESIDIGIIEVLNNNLIKYMLSMVPDLISIQDADMNIIYSNWQGFGAVPEENRILNTRCYRTYRNLDDICPDCQAIAVLQTGEAFRREVVLSGGMLVELCVVPILGQDGSVEFFMEWVRDITEHKRTESRLKNLEENTSDMVVRFNAELEHIFCNAAVERFFRFPKEHLLGKTLADLSRDVGMQGSGLLEMMANALEQCWETREEQHVEWRMHLHGEEKFLTTRVVPEFDNQGYVESLLAITQDATDRMLAEDGLTESEKRLETLVCHTPAVIYSFVITDGDPYT